LRRRSIRVLHGHCLQRVEARDGGLRATLASWNGARLGDGPAFDVDVVAMGYGFLPSDDVLRALGAAQSFDPVQRQRRTERDADGRTSVPEMFGVGDCCGLGGAQAARAEGVIAGLAAAASLGRMASSSFAAEEQRARAELARHRRFQRGLWRLFAAADPADALATPETLVCRCEEVSRGQIEAALDDGAPGIGAAKRLTRAGMGRCQGRYCAPHLAAMIAARDGVAIDAAAFFAPRPPIKPVRIGDLIRAAEP
jgi:NAD(P)H-nitrite reductase large subunit